MIWLVALALAAPPTRMVTLGGTVTEIVFALGVGDRVVGVDSSSLAPAEADALPDVGYYRQLGAEGVLSLRPDLVLASADAGPPTALAQLKAAGVSVHRLDATPSLDAAKARILEIGRVVERADAAAALVAQVDRDVANITRPAQPVRVLFVLAHPGGPPQVAGRGTAAGAMVELAGGTNAVTAWEGYRPLTPEAAVGAQPDVVLVTTRGCESMGGEAGVWAVPGLSATPAARQRALVVVDDLALLGFGPRVGATAAALARDLAQ